MGDNYYYDSEVAGKEDDEIYRIHNILLNSVRNQLQKVDYKQYLNDNKFNRYFENKVSGNFEWQQLPDEDGLRKAEIELDMKNAESEIYAGLIILNNFTNIRNRRLINNLYNYSTIDALKGALARAWLHNIKFINTNVVRARGRGRRPVIAVENPNTGREIKVNARTYKQIYGRIILKAIVKDITNFNTIEYEIKGNCVRSYVKENYGKDTLDKYISKKPTYLELMKMCKGLDINFSAKTITGILIDEYKTNRRKGLHIIISKEHMYVEDKVKKESKSEFEYEEFKDLLNNNNSNIIVTDHDDFKEIANKLKRKYELSDYNINTINFKSNIISLNPKYDDLLDYKETHKHNTNNIYSIIDRKYKLHGFMNYKTYSYFRNISIILNYSVSEECMIRLDGNKHYISQLYNRIFPIPSVNDYVKKYDNEKLREGSFYYCKLKKYNIIGFLTDGFYYYDLVIEMKKRNYIKDITYYLQPSNTTKINERYLPPLKYKKDDEEIVKDQSFLTSYIREYIGILRKTETSFAHSYDNITGDEAEALRLLHNNHAHINNKFTVFNNYKKYKTGLLAWIAIVQCSNLSLFLLDEKIRKLNDNVLLTSIKTDSLGYSFCNNKYKLPNDMICNNEINKFKIEYKNEKNITTIKIIDDIKDEIKKEHRVTEKINKLLNEYELNKFDKSNITNLLKDYESFIINGFAGLGKTYELINTIIPYFKEHKYKYIICSTTIQQANDLQKKINDKVYTIQNLFSRKNDNEKLRQLFESIDYVVIDEAVQITQDLLVKLEYVKRKYKINLIALSDKYQCIVDSYFGIAYIDTPFSHILFDCNIIQLKKHKNMRYDEELYDHLMYIIDNFEDSYKVRKYVLKNFKRKEETSTYMNIAYTNATCDEIYNDDTECVTVHSIQGRTLSKQFSFHDILKAPVSVIYTALSRAKSKNQITIICTLDKE